MFEINSIRIQWAGVLSRQMLAHLFNLLGRSFMAIPGVLGSNWLGLVSPIIIAVVGEAIVAWIFGWQAMRDNWKKATGIGLAAIGAFYTVVFVACILTTTYRDHIDLVLSNSRLRKHIGTDESHEEKSVQAVKDDLGSKFSILKENCAKTEGANGSLEKQTKDQQNTINNCQTEALKLLAPESQKLTVLTWSDAVTEGVEHNATYLLITNKLVTPVRIDAGCDVALKNVSAQIVGAGMESGGAALVNPRVLTINFSTPGWAPQSPIRLDVKYTSSRTGTCNFITR